MGIFDIRYVKLHFTLQIAEDTVMPRYKASAIRGGMGEMLLRANCIRDRICDSCDFESECIVRRTMYSKMEIQPEFMSSGDSVGYVTECEDYREEFREGDELKFNLIIFGKTIVYFSQYLNALYSLGMNGIGKEHSRFRIVSVRNTMNRDLLNGNDINMSEYRVRTISDYIAYRRRQAEKEPLSGKIRFRTPLTVKYRGEEIKEFDIEPIYEAAKIDGATPFQQFKALTLPFMIFVTTPVLLGQFVGNFNNFGIFYFLRGGLYMDNYFLASDTDLLINWLYNLSIDNNYYCIGAAISLVLFIITLH